MPRHIDRFLKHAPIQEEGPTLGRVFAVTRESWLLSEDPRTVEPRSELLASRRTALEAADLAREAADAFEQHGFHKPSGAWWASDGVRFHRFVVRPRRPGKTGAVIVGSSLAGLIALTAFSLLRRRKDRNPSRA